MEAVGLVCGLKRLRTLTCSLGNGSQFDRKHLFLSALVSKQSMWWETCHYCVGSISQARAWPEFRAVWTGSTTWSHLSKYGHHKQHYFESVLGLFLLKETFLLNLCDFLFISLSFHLHVLSQHSFVWVLIMSEPFSILILSPHPLSRVRIAPCRGGFSPRVSKYLGNKCANTQTHIYSHSHNFRDHHLALHVRLPPRPIFRITA